ncbi:hypothetical protein ASE66_14270 [Bosea sp. Root483D1]|jgi:hypothetical protein|uniref:hypothetical protein n=1 Tax=Bosea sp. Root483D1 TaxID=1736544 RepID=UPI0007093EBC|nr:hypothetical protein [Bosea sp. Root483D1]KRE14529.1 hypothetical protein ASE66_14270 [Bosea sp. Root483D1]
MDAPAGQGAQPKQVVAGDNLVAPQAVLKWYEIAEARIDASTIVLARETAAEFAAGRQDEVGFAILHRCGEHFHFLLLCTWRGTNELWETVQFIDEGMASFAPFDAPNAHRGTFCIWEMTAVSHETAAWRKFLLSPRSEADLEAYLRSRYTGEA